MTFIVLWFGGREASSVANGVFQKLGFAGITRFKFALVVLVIGLCEIDGRRNPGAGQLVVGMGLVLTCFPVVLAFFLLLVEVYST